MIFIAVAALLLVIGWFVKYKKVTWLISGYNTASKEKKAEYDIDKLARYFGSFLFVLAGSYFVWGIVLLMFSQYTDIILWCGFVTSFIVIVAGIIFLNSGNRLKKK